MRFSWKTRCESFSAERVWNNSWINWTEFFSIEKTISPANKIFMVMFSRLRAVNRRLFLLPSLRRISRPLSGRFGLMSRGRVAELLSFPERTHLLVKTYIFRGQMVANTVLFRLYIFRKSQASPYLETAGYRYVLLPAGHPHAKTTAVAVCKHTREHCTRKTTGSREFL